MTSATGGGPHTPRERHLADAVVPRSGFPYTEDHAVRGVPVLPLACAAEFIARAAAGRQGPSSGLLLRGLTVLKGVVFDPADRRPYFLRVRGTREADGLRLTLDSAAGRPHYRALVSTERPPPAPVPRLPPDGACAPSYAIYDGDVLFHGPRYRMLRTVDGLGPDGVRAVLDGLDGLGWDSDQPWATDPVALDGALQLAGLWARDALHRATLPMGVAEVRVHRGGALGTGLSALLSRREVGDQQAVCDVRLADAGGAAVAELIGVQLVTRPR